MTIEHTNGDEIKFERDKLDREQSLVGMCARSAERV